jgi:hypothetical protein
MGRPSGWGDSHARAKIRHHYGAVRVSGAPQPIHHGLQAPLDAVPGPGADIRLVDPQRLGNRLITPTYAIGQPYDAGSSGDLRRGAMCADQQLENSALQGQAVDSVSG